MNSSEWRELEVGRVDGVMKYVRFDCSCGRHIQFDCTLKEFRDGVDYLCECGTIHTVKKQHETVRI